MTHFPKTIADVPATYTALVYLLPPRPIRSRADYKRLVTAIDVLAGHALNSDQEDYLEALALVVHAYEARPRNLVLAGHMTIPQARRAATGVAGSVRARKTADSKQGAPKGRHPG